MNALSGKIALAAVMTAGLGLAGCVTQPYGNSGYSQGRSPGYSSQSARCNTCGVVQEVQQVYVQDNGHGGTLGAIIGAVAGGVLGNQVGKGDGRKAATVAGAVAGGVVGNQVGKRSGGQDTAWRIVVRLDDGRYATVTQRENPGLRRGDYVEVRNDRVYAR
ncbi:MAG: glycine zipper 2TM domain-containing protein [Rhodanobacter sp.]|nr:MAG: glycine zipper 2TM domain-containing protein [Rhodanobacter sp.]TAM38773.1 MAG: glycine zipper 2TM domain-containing protein [Rhodanobacter sp.]